ncbi:MAG: Fis family transcriptional regulator [Sandaracinaceae bacterium]|nr:Fis family transcriptional regulator [Sandaracinaceae bacterium]
MRSLLLCSMLACLGCDGGGGTPPGTDGGGMPPPAGETGRMVGMTAAHNAVRARVSASIPAVTWSAELAAIAQAYSESLASGACNLTHSSNGYGENLAMFGGTTAAPQDVVEAWASEESCYSYGTFMGTDACDNTCVQRSGGCGHFTQLVWADTRRIGCGVARCADGRTEIWTCNYDPPGNFLGRAPY